MSLVSKGPQLLKFGDMSNKIGDDNCSALYLLKLNGSGKTNTGATVVREVGFRIRFKFPQASLKNASFAIAWNT